MVDSVVGFLLQKLDSLLEEEAKLLKGVSTEVRRIKEELDGMKVVLKDADAKAESNAAGVKHWVSEVREAAYDIEDVLDEYTLRLTQARIHHGHEVSICLRIIRQVKHLKMRHRIADQIQELRIHVADISSRKEKYNFKTNEQGSPPDQRVSHLRSYAHAVEDSDLEGIESPRNELIGLLVGGESMGTTISIFGMGGLGKTTLVQKVYDSEQVKTHFKAFAWVPVSQNFSIEEIFRRLVKEICKHRSQRANKMKMGELIEELKSSLRQKRYVIVLDDIWKVEDWECIKTGLPDGQPGSRIMVTTRDKKVAAACVLTSDHVYSLPPLNFNHSWNLFCKKAFYYEFDGFCPLDMQQLSVKIVQKCGGLPLAIRTIGRLLSTQTKTLVERQKLYNSLSHLIQNSSSHSSMNEILLLSYNDLPYHLKPCFMYISIFPEDYLIRPMKLIQLWVAEGFVERKKDMTLEEVAEDYLHELINRSLIQVASYTDYGTIKACRVHDVVREIILLKAREEKFVTFLGGTELGGKSRRMALTGSDNTVPQSDLSHLRTFFTFGENQWPDSLMNRWLSGFRLLKVLDLEGIQIDKFPDGIVNLLHLRFLSFRYTWIESLSESIGMLEKLETLDLCNTGITELPASIVKLKSLRHLLAHRFVGHRIKGVKVSPGVGSLRSLQQLGYIKSDQSNDVMIQKLGELTQLKFLGISELTSKNALDLCDSIEKMTCLSWLAASSENWGKGDLDLKGIRSPPPLKHVVLRGHLKELHWIPSLSNLVHLTLEDSRVKEDPLNALQHLGNLMKLKLIRAYDGQVLRCEAQGFQKLKSLLLHDLPGLQSVNVAKGAMPSLEKLRIWECIELEEVPLGIEHLTHLKQVDFHYATEALGRSIEEDGGVHQWARVAQFMGMPGMI